MNKKLVEQRNSYRTTTSTEVIQYTQRKREYYTAKLTFLNSYLGNFEVKPNYDEIIVVDDNKKDSTEMAYGSTEQGQIETTYNYQEQAQPDNSYRSKLRKNIKKPD